MQVAAEVSNKGSKQRFLSAVSTLGCFFFKNTFVSSLRSSGPARSGQLGIRTECVNEYKHHNADLLNNTPSSRDGSILKSPVLVFVLSLKVLHSP